MRIFLGLAVFLALGQTHAIATDWPDWAKDLSPSVRFRLRWDERMEDTRDQSTPQLLVQMGVTPKFHNYFRLGFELSTGGTSIGSSPDSIDLSNASTSKSFNIRKAFIAAEISDPLRAEVLAGKFSNPITTSPLLWYKTLTPEGLSEKIETAFNEGAIRLSFWGNQWSLDQLQASAVNGTPHRRSWLFVESINGTLTWANQNQVSLAINQYSFADLSEGIAQASASLGNTVIGSNRFRYKYAPSEIISEISGQPLGISSGARGAFAMNFRSPDRQRGFWVEGHLGNPWLARHYFAALSYIYSEPDLSVAAFTDRDYGSSNRKGFLAEVNYYFWNECRVGGSFLFVETLANSSTQGTRKEIKIDTEFKF